jgi:hypothetical protein
MRRAIGVAAIAALASVAATAAAEASRVLVVSDRGADPVVLRAEVRLAAELRAAGFLVEERQVDGSDDARSYVEEGGEAGPFATVLLRRAASGAATDVWVADHVTHKTVVRRLDASGRGDAADRALALRVVELMRASLVEALVLPPPSDATPVVAAPPADVAAWTRDSLRDRAAPASHVAVALGVAGAFAGPGAGVGLAPDVRVAWRPTEAWSLGLLAAGPAFGARVSATEGAADLRQELAVVEGAYELALGGPVHAYFVAGAGAYHLDATGDANAPFTSARGDAWSALLAAGAGLRLHVAGPASLVLDLRELLALPRPVVALAADRAAQAMSPGTLAGLSFSVEL